MARLREDRVAPANVRRLAVVVAMAHLAGCGRGPTFDFEPGPEDRCANDACFSASTVQRAADILFVIDNSGSMGVEQGTLAANFPAFIEVLDAQRFGASYRIGMTTTDATATLRMSSCRGRLFEFIFDDLAGTVIDEQQSGCLASCAFEEVTTTPTSTAKGGEAIPRPWIEKAGPTTNLADGVSIADAMRCVGPQGINGSGFEAPLESMHDVLIGAGNTAGFFRDEALSAIVFLTDETDCSMPPRNEQILVSDAASALWTDPEGATSGACWRAGTTCTGDPSAQDGLWDECYAEDKGLDGRPTDVEPILYPVKRYVDALSTFAADKARRGGTGSVLVAVIGGVPLDYPETGEQIYRESDDEEFNREFGIGPSCGIGTETPTSPPGIPPVRLQEFAEQFAGAERNLFSICSNDYTVALGQIVDGLAELSARTCVPGCVADFDDDEPGLQPSCRMVERTGDAERVVQRCAVAPGEPDGWTFPGVSPDLCYRALIDLDGDTPAISDDVSRQCVTQGGNVELVVERLAGAVEDPGVEVVVECELVAPVGTPCGEA